MLKFDNTVHGMETSFGFQMASFVVPHVVHYTKHARTLKLK